MNKTLFIQRYEWVLKSYPQIRYADGIPLRKTDKTKAGKVNISSVYLTDLYRYWLYFDLLRDAPDVKVREWFLTYVRNDFVRYNDALEAVYELARRDQLQSLTVSQFKAAIKEFGFTPNVLLGPIWPEIERLLLDRKSGPLDVGTIRRVVQWTRLSARMTLDNPSLEAECAERFQCNQDRLHQIWSADDSTRDTYVRGIKKILRAWIPDMDFHPLPGRHGSGAVAEEVAKHRASRKCLHLGESDQLLAFYVKRFDVDAKDDVGPLYPRLLRGPVPRVSRWLTVPKSIRKRRGIAPQPSLLQFHQQGILLGMYHCIWHTPYTQRKLRLMDEPRARFIQDHFPIFNRDVNREIAVKASLYDHWSTYDLSDASDSISVHLVKGVFGQNLRSCLIACRCSATTSHPDMETYGTMGDATVFPTETLVIGAAVQLALILAKEHDTSVHLTQFTVFGDDICVQNNPTVHHYIHDIFAHLGFKINDDKSFLSGNYRESCGVEAYCGCEIQPWYFLNRTSWPVDRENQVATLISAANHQWDRDYRACRMFTIHLLQEKCWLRNLIPFTTRKTDSAKVYTPFLTDRGVYRVQMQGPPGDKPVLQKPERLQCAVISATDDNQSLETWEDWYRYYLWLAYPPTYEPVTWIFHWRGIIVKSDHLYESTTRSFLNRTLHIRKVWVDVDTLE